MSEETQRAQVAQVGGGHYKNDQVVKAHWDLMEEYDVSYLEATATKYVVRYDLKDDPTKDLLKGASYLDKVLTFDRGTRRKVPAPVIDTFCDQAGLSSKKRSWLKMVLCWGDQALLAEVSQRMKIEAGRHRGENSE